MENINFEYMYYKKPTQNTKLCLPKLFQLPTTSSSYQLSVLSVLSVVTVIIIIFFNLPPLSIDPRHLGIH